MKTAYSKVFETRVEIVDSHLDKDGDIIYHGILEDDDGYTFLLFRPHELSDFKVNNSK